MCTMADESSENILDLSPKEGSSNSAPNAENGFTHVSKNAGKLLSHLYKATFASADLFYRSDVLFYSERFTRTALL